MNIFFDRSEDFSLWQQCSFGEFGIVKLDEDLYGNDDKAASLAVLDHRPLWARYDTSRDDD